MNEKECRRLVRERADGWCERCGLVMGDSYHHRKKKSQCTKEERWCPANGVWVCGSGTTGCHGWVEHNPNDAEWEGFHVRPWQDPIAIPVSYRGDWKFLKDNGEKTASVCFVDKHESRDLPRGDQVPSQRQAS